MIQAFLRLLSMVELMNQAEAIEKRTGRACDRFWLVVTVPARALAIQVGLSLVARLLGGLRPRLGRQTPDDARLRGLWATILGASGRGPLAPVVGRAGWRSSRANAIALGLGPTALAVVIGGALTLPDDELEAVLAHELAHIEGRHILFLGATSGLVAAGLPLLARRYLPAPTVTPASLALGGALTAAATRATERRADGGAVARLADPTTLARALRHLTALETARRARSPLGHLVARLRRQPFGPALLAADRALDRVYASHDGSEVRAAAIANRPVA